MICCQADKKNKTLEESEVSSDERHKGYDHGLTDCKHQDPPENDLLSFLEDCVDFKD